MPVVRPAAVRFGDFWIHYPCLLRVVEAARITHGRDIIRAETGGKIEAATVSAAGH